MYERYFGFKERPFRLVPDPAYLFLSRSHQEAMAHLVYTVEAGEGFVSLTGEVGTGKTTLCRAFLEQLDPATEVAYIFNPPSDPVDLIRAVNRDFGLSADSKDLQKLIHLLNAFLIEKKGESKEILLIIDEAQNLNRHVLEQIRLLSNLETSRNKLLQIVLVGQPELNKTLQTDRLRQLRQRITLRCRLDGLSLVETEAYIRHRIHVASENGRLLFTNGAIRRIFRFSDGIPRLINMACDRGLLAAFTEDRKIVDARIARKAIKELYGSSSRTRKRWRSWRVAFVAATFCLISALLFYGPFSRENIITGMLENGASPISTEHPGKDSLRSPPPADSTTVALQTPLQEKPASLERWLHTVERAKTRSKALVAVFALWDDETHPSRFADYLKDDPTFFQLSAGQAGMEVYEVEDRLDLLTRLDLPAILEFVDSASSLQAFGVLVQVEGDRYLLSLPGRSGVVSIDGTELYQHWSGKAYVPWKNFFAISGQIPGSAPGESLVTLKLLLRDLGYKRVDLKPQYDKATRQAVMDVQANQNLPVDGVVGSMTKIALYKMKKGLKIPTLRKHRENLRTPKISGEFFNRATQPGWG